MNELLLLESYGSVGGWVGWWVGLGWVGGWVGGLVGGGRRTYIPGGVGGWAFHPPTPLPFQVDSYRSERRSLSVGYSGWVGGWLVG